MFKARTGGRSSVGEYFSGMCQAPRVDPQHGVGTKYIKPNFKTVFIMKCPLGGHSEPIMSNSDSMMGSSRCSEVLTTAVSQKVNAHSIGDAEKNLKIAKTSPLHSLPSLLTDKGIGVATAFLFQNDHRPPLLVYSSRKPT